ncbi:hypothetical protein BS78_02G185600 [Paspalum vaginatum]|nr:hypothetical protein BS78_02G185600 [Paspalum vaginatum]
MERRRSNARGDRSPSTNQSKLRRVGSSTEAVHPVLKIGDGEGHRGRPFISEAEAAAPLHTRPFRAASRVAPRDGSPSHSIQPSRSHAGGDATRSLETAATIPTAGVPGFPAPSSSTPRSPNY